MSVPMPPPEEARSVVTDYKVNMPIANTERYRLQGKYANRKYGEVI